MKCIVRHVLEMLSRNLDSLDGAEKPTHHICFYSEDVHLEQDQKNEIVNTKACKKAAFPIEGVARKHSPEHDFAVLWINSQDAKPSIFRMVPYFAWETLEFLRCTWRKNN